MPPSTSYRPGAYGAGARGAIAPCIAPCIVGSSPCYHLGNGFLVVAMAGDRESLKKQLGRAQRVLQIALEQKAGYGLRVPVDLELEIEEKQREVTRLEAELAQSGSGGARPQESAGVGSSVTGEIGAVGNAGTIGNAAGKVEGNQIYAETVVINNYSGSSGAAAAQSPTGAGAVRLEIPTPKPEAELEVPGGVMPVGSPFYVPREPWETRCCQEIEKPGGLVRIKAPRQMGKTSLMARIRHHAQKTQGDRIVAINFQQLEEEPLQDLKQLLLRLCALASRQLGVSPRKVREYLEDDLFGPKENCTEYFARELLPVVEKGLLLELDEVDRVFPFNKVAVEFLLMLRDWREQANQGVDPWPKMRIALVHSTHVYVQIPASTSPFNVGLDVELSGFNDVQVLELARQHGLAWREAGEVRQLMALVEGHPYLVRRALYFLALGDLTLEELQRTAATDEGIFGEHLRHYGDILQNYPELKAIFRQVVASAEPLRIDPTAAKQLEGLGLVTREGDRVRVRYRFYRAYFRKHLEA